MRPRSILTLASQLPAEPLLTRDEAADRLHVSKSTLVRLARAGLISEIRVTEHSIRIRASVIDGYLADRETGAVA